MPSDIEIAQAAKMQRIAAVAKEKLGIGEEHLEPYGHYKAKVSLKYLDTLKGKKDGKLVLVTAISPTPAGEGKTTTTVGLGDALNHIGKKAVICLREPSLGPVFGMKGGAAGVRYEHHVLVGSVAESLVKHAKEKRCDLICIGTRGHSELGKALVGSTATKVVHISDIPVLLVK